MYNSRPMRDLHGDARGRLLSGHKGLGIRLATSAAALPDVKCCRNCRRVVVLIGSFSCD